MQYIGDAEILPMLEGMTISEKAEWPRAFSGCERVNADVAGNRGAFTPQRSPSRRSVVGILGGMGPMATADFYLKLVQATPAAIDQEHLQVLIWSDPTIPDRSEALLTHGADPTPALIAGAKLLQQSGAGMLAVPCNTAHAFLTSVQAEVGIPIIHMIEETAKHVGALSPDIQRVACFQQRARKELASIRRGWTRKASLFSLPVPIPRRTSLCPQFVR